MSFSGPDSLELDAPARNPAPAARPAPRQQPRLRVVSSPAAEPAAGLPRSRQHVVRQVDHETAGLLRGLLFAVPISLTCWGLIGAAIWSLF